jgi:predicted nucleic acid-binding protein
LTFVMDVSIAASWCLEDEAHPDAEAALIQMEKQGAIVPALFWFELRNVLLMAERRKRVSEAQTIRSLSFIRELAIKVDHEPLESLTLSLARSHRLSFYDASYLELAQRKMLPLATLDGDLAKAARAEGVELIGKQD